MSPTSGYCRYWLSGKTVEVDNAKNLLEGKTWTQIRSEAVMCPANECFVPLKSYVANICHQSGKCPGGAGKWGN